MFLDWNDRNEAGILTARKDLDYIGREELLEALKRVSSAFHAYISLAKQDYVVFLTMI